MLTEMQIIWLVLIIAAATFEGITVQIVSIWFSLGGIAALITSFFTEDILIQSLVFLVISFAALAATRPLVKKIQGRKAEPTNSDRIIGKTAVVTLEVNNSIGQGQALVGSEKWSARSESGEILPVGAEAVIKAIEGVKIILEIQD